MQLKATRTTVTVGNGQSVSSGFTPDKNALFVMVRIPSCDDGDVTLELSIDAESTWQSIIGDDGQPLTVLSSGYDPGWKDISDFIRAVPADPSVSLRINLGIVQTAERTLTILQKG